MICFTPLQKGESSRPSQSPWSERIRSRISRMKVLLPVPHSPKRPIEIGGCTSFAITTEHSASTSGPNPMWSMRDGSSERNPASDPRLIVRQPDAVPGGESLQHDPVPLGVPLRGELVPCERAHRLVERPAVVPLRNQAGGGEMAERDICGLRVDSRGGRRLCGREWDFEQARRLHDELLVALTAAVARLERTPDR